MHALDKSSESQANVKFLIWLLQLPLWSTVAQPPRAFPLCLDKTPMQLTKAVLFWFELTSLALALEPQSTLSKDPSKGMYPRCYGSVCTLPWPPHVVPWGMPCFPQDLWVINLYINFSFGLSLNYDSPSGTLCST